MSGQNNEPEVTVDSLSASLNDLVKAADATDLVKGGSSDQNRVEHTGTRGSDGEQGGGRGGYPGNAKIDDMMIGKLAALGLSASQIAAVDMVGKQKDEEEEDDDDSSIEIEVGKMRAYMKSNGGSIKGYPGLNKSGDVGDGEPLNKSMDQFRQDPDINSALDVSPYLEAMTARTAEQIDAVNTQLAKGFGTQSVVNRAMAGAMHQMGQLIKSQSAIIGEMGHRLGIVERQPLPQRGVTSPQQLHKSMPGEAGPAGAQPLHKSEALAVLSYMNLEKGIKHINGTPTSQAIGMIEGGGQVDPAVLQAAQDFLAQNPSEAQTARQYH